MVVIKILIAYNDSNFSLFLCVCRHRFSDDKWEPSYIATVGVDCKWRVFNIDGERVKLEVWDTAGQERFKAISAAYFRNVDGVIFAYVRRVVCVNAGLMLAVAVFNCRLNLWLKVPYQ